MNRGQRARLFCFDCDRATGAHVAVWRRLDGQPIDWSQPDRDGARVTYVCRAGTGCGKGRTPDEVRTNPA